MSTTRSRRFDPRQPDFFSAGNSDSTGTNSQSQIPKSKTTSTSSSTSTTAVENKKYSNNPNNSNSTTSHTHSSSTSAVSHKPATSSKISEGGFHFKTAKRKTTDYSADKVNNEQNQTLQTFNKRIRSTAGNSTTNSNSSSLNTSNPSKSVSSTSATVPSARSKSNASTSSSSSKLISSLPVIPPLQAIHYPQFDYHTSDPRRSYLSLLNESVSREIQLLDQSFAGEFEYISTSLCELLTDIMEKCPQVIMKQSEVETAKTLKNDLMQPNRINEENEAKLHRYEELIKQMDKQITSFNQAKNKLIRSTKHNEKPLSTLSAEDEKFIFNTHTGKLKSLLQSAPGILSMRTGQCLTTLKQLQSDLDEINSQRNNLTQAVNQATKKPFDSVGGIHDPKKLIQSVTQQQTTKTQVKPPV